MTKAKKIYIINDITSTDFYLANTYQIENDCISFEHGADKFQAKSLSYSSKSAKMVIYYVEIH